MAKGQLAADIVLVLAPLGADAANISAVLRNAEFDPHVCRTDADLRARLAGECAIILLTEEALTPGVRAALNEAFDAQPAWSDIPVVLITSTGASSAGQRGAEGLRGPRRMVTLIERPLRSVTLLATLQTVLAARHRQYEIRDLLDERDELLSSLELRVAERTAELQRMVEEMEAFSYSVSHDLRAPLRRMAGYAQALQEDHAAELPAAAQYYLDKIARAAQRMDNLTQDLLAYTRIAQGAIEIVAVDLDPLVAEVIEQYPGLDSLSDYIHVRRPLGRVLGHAPSLVQCFSNLLGNAMKFIPAGRVPRIEVSATHTPAGLRVSVHDNGTGIDAAHHERIFQMFERAADRRIPGTGIGLAIVKKAVQRMGGTVGVNSAPGDGAEFWFVLRDAEAATIAPAGTGTPTEPRETGNPRTVVPVGPTR